MYITSCNPEVQLPSKPCPFTAAASGTPSVAVSTGVSYLLVVLLQLLFSASARYLTVTRHLLQLRYSLLLCFHVLLLVMRLQCSKIGGVPSWDIVWRTSVEDPGGQFELALSTEAGKCIWARASGNRAPSQSFSQSKEF